MPSLLKSTLTYAPSIIVPRLFSYLIVIIFTRLLAPSEFGLYSLIITYGELLDSVCMNWLRLGMLRFLRNDHREQKKGLVKANLFFYAISIGTGLLGAGVLSLTVGNSTSPFLFFFILAVYLIGNATMRFGLTILRATEDKGLYTILEVFRPTFSFASIFLVMHFFGPSFASLTFGFFGFTALFALGTVSWIIRDYLHQAANWQAMRQMLHYALPLILMFLLTSIIRATDRYMLTTLIGTASVGLFAASYSISRPALELFFNAINLGAFPQLVKMYENKGSPAASNHLKRILQMQLYLGLPMVAGIAALAKPLATVLLGAEYRQVAITLMPLMAITGIVAGIKSFTFDQIFHLKQRSIMHAYTLFPAAIANMALNYLLIPTYGTYGAAWATLISFSLALSSSIVLSRRVFVVPLPYREAGIALFSSFIMYVTLNYCLQGKAPVQIILAIPTGIAIYFTTSLICHSSISRELLSHIWQRKKT